MAQGIGQFTLAPLVSSNIFVDGTFTNACGDLFDFHLHPPMGGSPGGP
jgi:hypothetical protein